MGKCPACKTKLKLTPLLGLKFLRPRPCPNCGAMIYRRIWPWFVMYAGFALIIYGKDLFDVEKSQWVRHLSSSSFYALIVAWNFTAMATMTAGGILGNRFRMVREH